MTAPTVDIAEYTCKPKDTVRDVLKRVDQSRFLFQIIVGDNGALLGTVTDGDIRRAMLQNVGLDASIEACMQVDPVVGLVGQNDENQRRLRNIGSNKRAQGPEEHADHLGVEMTAADNGEGQP